MSTSEEDSNFVFINISHPDDLKTACYVHYVRHRAMSHCGRLRRKKDLKKKLFTVVFELPEVAPRPEPCTMLLRVGLDTLDPFASRPFTLDNYASGLCSSYFESNTGYSSPLRAACSVVGFHNEIIFQLFLSSCVLNLQKLRAESFVSKQSKESMRLYSKGLQLLQKRLDDPKQHTSDDVLTSMAGFLSYHRLIGDYAGWNAHMAGLCKMIDLRGGLDGFSVQVHMVLSWTDICGAFSQDTPPRLPLPPTWIQASTLPIAPTLSTGVVSTCKTWHKEFPESQQWIATYRLLSTLLLHSDPSEWIEFILHRLLLLRPARLDIPLSRSVAIETVCRYGTLLFLAPIWRAFGNQPVISTAIRVNLSVVLNAHVVDWGRLRSLLLWTLAHAARESEDQVERADFAFRLAIIMEKMGLGRWEDLVREMKSVLWVGGLDESWKLVEFELESVLCSQGELSLHQRIGESVLAIRIN